MTPISLGFGGAAGRLSRWPPSGLIVGQSQEFLPAVTALAQSADAARRES